MSLFSLHRTRILLDCLRMGTGKFPNAIVKDVNDVDPKIKASKYHITGNKFTGKQNITIRNQSSLTKGKGKGRQQARPRDSTAIGKSRFRM